MTAKQGDIIRVPALGPVKANPDHDLVFLFLGSCHQSIEDPGVPGFLRQLGFQRTHVFLATLVWQDENGCREEDPHTFTAKSPREAVAATVRVANYLQPLLVGAKLRSVTLQLLKVGDINSGGMSETTAGKVFAAWSSASGLPITALLDDRRDPPG